MNSPKVAIVHDWLTGMRGGERVLEHFLLLYPDADLFTLVHRSGATSVAIDRRVTGTSFLQRLPRSYRYYKLLIPIFPAATSRIKLSGYDLVISLSHAAVKNVRVDMGTRHVCYCFTPMRYIWDQARSYLGPLTPFAWPLIHLLRGWDRRGAQRVDEFISISRFVASRIRRYYGRRAAVIYPPVDTSWITPATEGVLGEAFLYAGALVPYKRVEVIIEAFRNRTDELWVVGDGPLKKKLMRRATANIKFFGRVDDQQLATYYQRCKALIFPATEDFGLVPIECMAAGRPVIGVREGALVESVAGISYEHLNRSAGSATEDLTGIFFQKKERRIDQAIEVRKAVDAFLQHEKRFSVSACVARAGQFSKERFVKEWEVLNA